MRASDNAPSQAGAMTDRQGEIVEMAGVTKRFPGVTALNRVSVDFRRGEVHAVVGENGAGKSTLMNVLAGEFPPNEGEIRIDGKPVRFASPLDSRRAGIVVVYQELALIRREFSRQNVDQGRLAGAVLADDRVHFPAAESNGDEIERDDAGEPFGHPGYLDDFVLTIRHGACS